MNHVHWDLLRQSANDGAEEYLFPLRVHRCENLATETLIPCCVVRTVVIWTCWSAMSWDTSPICPCFVCTRVGEVYPDVVEFSKRMVRE